MKQFLKFISDKRLGFTQQEIEAFDAEYRIPGGNNEEDLVDLETLLEDIMDCEEINDEEQENKDDDHSNE